MGKKELKKMFVRFLKEKNCYNLFEKNMKRCVFEQKYYGLPINQIFLYSDNPIEDYFKWSSTNEGYEFWQDISRLWVSLYYSV